MSAPFMGSYRLIIEDETGTVISEGHVPLGVPAPVVGDLVSAGHFHQRYLVTRRVYIHRAFQAYEVIGNDCAEIVVRVRLMEG